MITIWHNPRCSKSRQTLALLDGRSDVTVRKYLEDTPDPETLKATAALLGGAAAMIRPKEARFKELELSLDSPEDTLLQAMAANPILIERPIVLANGKAAIGRPPESVLDIL